jgi:hypothetical protein
MARIARIVVPGVPHHITQRGNNQQDVFFVAKLEKRLGRRLRSLPVGRPRKPTVAEQGVNQTLPIPPGYRY